MRLFPHQSRPRWHPSCTRWCSLISALTRAAQDGILRVQDGVALFPDRNRPKWRTSCTRWRRGLAIWPSARSACSDRHHLVYTATDRFCWPSSAGIAKAAVVITVACLQVFAHPFDSNLSILFPDQIPQRWHPSYLLAWRPWECQKATTSVATVSQKGRLVCVNNFKVIPVIRVKQTMLHYLVRRYLMVYLLYVGMGRESSKLYIVMILADLDLYCFSCMRTQLWCLLSCKFM